VTPLRQPAVAGRFYPRDAEELARQVAGFLGAPAPGARVLGAVVPHAGYVYSGRVAGATFRRLAVPARVVVLGPNHTGRGVPVSVAASGAFRVPGADVPIDAELAAAVLAHVPGARADLRAHAEEHALEVELPFLVARRPDVRIVPVVLGGLDGRAAVAVGQGLARALAGAGDVLVLASSDMSHYLPQAEANRRDHLALERLLALDALGLHDVCEREDVTMCGVLPATALVACARALGWSGSELVAYATSGDAFGDYAHVVGYAGVLVGTTGPAGVA
jgi:AmmeMemoRadiSam system protein B